MWRRCSRTRSTGLQNAQAGSLAAGGMRPYGFTINRRDTVPEEAAVIREVTGRILAGGSPTGIVTDLNRRRVPTSYGGTWTLPRLQGTLKRPSLCGRVVHKGDLMRDEDGQPVKAEWDPILSEAEFDQLQLTLAARRRSPSARWTSNRRHLLSGICRCGLCVAKMIGSKQTNGLLAYVSPAQKHLGRSKPHLERHVIEAVKEKASGTAFDIRSWSDEAAEDTRRQIAHLERRKHDSITQLVDGRIDAATLTAVTAQYGARIDALRESLVGRTVEAEAFDAVTFDLAGFDAMPVEEQHAAIAMFVRRIVVHPAGRGRRFDLGLIDIEWRDLDAFRWRGVVERKPGGETLDIAMSGR
jgi:Recombinase